MVLSVQPQDGVVNGVFGEVGVFQRITSVGQSKSHTVSAEPLDGIVHDQEVTLALGHLFFVSQQVTVGTDRLGPVLLGEDGHVVVDPEDQVVLDQVLARGAQVNRVPVSKFFLQLSQSLGRNTTSRGSRSVAENVLEELNQR